MPQANPARPWAVTRDHVHDLRNLFSVILSARHLLDDAQEGEQREMLMVAIEDAAMKGCQIAAELVVHPDVPPRIERIDLNHFIRSLEPELIALLGRHLTLHLQLCAEALPVEVDVDTLEAVLIELVTNARAAQMKPGKVHIRTHRRGHRAWLMIADDGRGMPRLKAQGGAGVPQTASGRGCGLRRIERFVRHEHGRLRIRSRIGIGTAVSLILPVAPEPGITNVDASEYAGNLAHGSIA